MIRIFIAVLLVIVGIPAYLQPTPENIATARMIGIPLFGLLFLSFGEYFKQK